MTKRNHTLTQETFDSIKRIIFELSGIYLNDSKREMVYSRLARVVNKNKLASIDEYIQTVLRGSSTEKQAFINVLTTNKTSFYRESYHFDILESFVKHNFPDRNPKIWCSAASTGEEPYTIAMTLFNAFKGYDHKGTILATDIDTNVLLKSSKGVYTEYDIENILTHDLGHFFVDCEMVGKRKVVDNLKKGLTFKRFNLTKNFPTADKFDVIFCRNVMIYFNQETQRLILEMFKERLNRGGILLVGHSENFTYFASDLFRPIGKTTYCHSEDQRDVSEIVGPVFDEDD